MKVAIEQVFDGSLPQIPIGGVYDPDKINVGKHTGQYNIGSDRIDKFIGPSPVTVINSAESQLAIPSSIFSPIKITDDLYWLFGNDAAGASATRRVQLWTFIPSINRVNYVGAITLNFPGGGSATVTSMKVILTNYTSGSVTVNANTVTGSNTTWSVGLSVGSRIGFGSTDPQQISTWYPIASIPSDTSLTITGSATVPSGSSYVIQDLIILHSRTNSPNIFLAKGIRFEDFINPATSIPAASTVDKIKAVYGLSSAGGAVVYGFDTNEMVSWTTQSVYTVSYYADISQKVDVGSGNIRTPLTSLVSGVQSGVITSRVAGVYPNIGTFSNGKLVTLKSGSFANSASYYWYSLVDVGLRPNVSSIIGSSLSQMEITGSQYILEKIVTEKDPPGLESWPYGLRTNITGGNFVAVNADESIDKLTAVTSTGNMYITNFFGANWNPPDTRSQTPLTRRIGCLTTQLPSALKNSNSPNFVHSVLSNNALINSLEGWMFYNYTRSSTSNVNGVAIYPLGADIEYFNYHNNRIICPRITLQITPIKYYRLLVNCVKNIGDTYFGVTPDMYKVQYRTQGISNNSGSWIDIPQDGDMSKTTPSNEIQFAFQFRTAGVIMLPARILSLALLYENEDGIPSQFAWNYQDTNLNSGVFSWIQNEYYNDINKQRIELYRFDNDELLMSQELCENKNGIVEYWNGSVWLTGLGENAIGTKRRFVPTRLIPKDINVYAKLINQ